MPRKKASIETVAQSIDDLAGFTKKELSKTNKSINKSIDDLAIAVKQGFDQATYERKELKRGMEEIKMKFAYTAWQLDVEELNLAMEIPEAREEFYRELDERQANANATEFRVAGR